MEKSEEPSLPDSWSSTIIVARIEGRVYLDFRCMRGAKAIITLITSDLDPATGHHDFVGTGQACDTCGFGPNSDWHTRRSND